MGRRSEIERVTSETQVSVTLDLDERSGVRVETGIGFFDHMLNALARHGGLGLSLTCKGDLWIDAHHSMEDTGLALGQALREAVSLAGAAGEIPSTKGTLA